MIELRGIPYADLKLTMIIPLHLFMDIVPTHEAVHDPCTLCGYGVDVLIEERSPDTVQNQVYSLP